MSKAIDDSDQMAWLHSEQRLALRAECLLALMKTYGGAISPEGAILYSAKGLYGASHDYVSHGNKDATGIIAYYQANIETYNPATD